MDNKPDMFADPEGWESHLIERLTRTMAADADNEQARGERTIGDMVANTEREVFHEGAFPENEGPYEGTVDMDGLSQMEGWDGLPLSDAEGLARAIQGDEVDGYIGDRPLQHQHELSVDQENALLRQQLQNEKRARQETINRLDPYAQEQRKAAQEQFYEQNGMFAYEQDKANALFGRVEQRATELNNNRINESLTRAHQEYGDEFTKTFDQLRTLNPQDPLARQIAQSILGSDDPGTALMEYHGSPLLSRGRTSSPPFAPGRGGVARSRPARQAQGWPDDGDQNHNSGYGNESVEDAIFSSACDK
jgi:hypothetical protein